jgi:CMP-2-keto-3-deoxyoctulosonic acid synthetase
MSPNTDDCGFEETPNVPRGRKARQVPAIVLDTLERSAKHGKAFAKTAAPDLIDELRRDLGSAAVRTRYEITMGTERISDEKHKLTFAAKHRVNGQGSQVPAQAAAAQAAAS